MSNVSSVMFDFLNSKLSPKIHCTSAAMDGYSADNLISSNDIVRSRGFLSYTSIKPPVDIDFELLCSISVGYVFVSTTVGTQKSNGIELLARNGKSCEFVSIAKATFDKEDGVFFCNSRLFSASSPPINYNKRYYLCFLKRDTFRVFINASEIRVRILRANRSVPCIGKVEIWGRVSKLCSETTANTVKNLMQPPNALLPINHNVHSTCSTSTRSNNVDEIPEDFKDALTFEIMTIPMTLPSGSTIDSTTLEKFIQIEASHGRHPSDPFTGLKFTDTRKPVLNAYLKSRIDMFLLQHADIAKSHCVSRTVGKRNDTILNTTLINQVNVKRNASEDLCNSNKRAKTCENDNNDDDELLNALIEKTVTSKDFIRFTSEEENKVNNTCICNECETTECLYILPCKHLYCRKCLMSVCHELKCKNCLVEFTRADPKKFHVA